MQTLSLPSWATAGASGLAPRANAASWDAHSVTRLSGRTGSSQVASADAHRDPRVMRMMQANVQDAIRRQAALRMVAGALLRMVVGPEPDVVFKSSDETFNATARAWLEQARLSKRFDVRRMDSLGELAEQVVMAALDAGRIGFVKVDDGSSQAIESARIVNPAGRLNGYDDASGFSWRDGVKVDRLGRPVAYRVADWGKTGTYIDAAKGVEIPFDRFLYLRNPILPDVNATTREPALQSGLEWMDSIWFGVKAINAAANQAAYAPMILEHPFPNEATQLMLRGGVYGSESGAVGTSAQGTDTGSGTVGEIETSYGTMFIGPQGMMIKQVDPKHPNPQLEWFFIFQFRVIAASLGLPLEAVLFLFNQSYTAHRAAFACAWPTIEKWQGWVVYGFIIHAIRHALATDIRTGAFARFAPKGQALRVPDDWRMMDVILPTMPIFDQVSEVDAATKRMEQNLSTLEDETRKLTGRDSAEVLRKRADEVKRMRELGIEPPKLPGAAPGGNGQMANGQRAKEGETGSASGEAA